MTRNTGESPDPEDEDWPDTAGEAAVNQSESRRRYLVRRSHLMSITVAWVVTVPASGLLAAGIYALFTAAFK